MHNYKIIVEYDGTNFFGWQLQKGQRTVQGEIESALRKINGGKIVRIHGAGRTDTGVHARGQVANFKLEKKWECEELRNAINGNTGEDVLIRACEIVQDDFHARFSAKRRSYRYVCRTNNSIIDRKYVWRIPKKLNLGKLQQCAKLILGENDFTSFSKYVPDLNHRRCIIYQSEWIKRKDLLIYMIEANRFLQHMIRYLVGTMVEVATGNLSVDDFKAILNEKNPQAKVSKAPSKGLYLEKITY